MGNVRDLKDAQLEQKPRHVATESSFWGDPKIDFEPKQTPKNTPKRRKRKVEPIIKG